MSESHGTGSSWKRNIGMMLAVLVGVAIIIVAPKLKKPPKQIPVQERPVKVSSIKVPSLDVVPVSTGFGRVSPGRTWESVAEVSGQVVWISDELQDGNVVAAGTELLRIEDANYRLILAQKEALLQSSEVKTKTAKDALVISKKNLELLQSEYKRQHRLAANGTVSKAALENSERQLLTGKTQVQELQNSLNLISAEHLALVAQRDAAKLDLKRTVKTAPFDVRLTKVKIGIAQYANKGQLMFTGDGLDVAEIEAQFSIGSLRPLISGMITESVGDIRVGATMLNAVVNLKSATHTIEWPARVDRVAGSIDPQTQTIGVIVAVDRPYAIARPGKRPPLLRDTFVEVALSSAPVKQTVIPWSAVHGDTVYIVDNDSRLEMRKVKIQFSQRGYSVVAKGLKPGEQIVTSDLISASDGMLLNPQEDKKSEKRLITEATGKEPKK
ncbi:MAG: efflux RND transporter periplasmic adaptor subunit [Gammaproteobacteria bacterium]|nr:efflux RND transporter periplasmic adaptor subunit [Gammaproteobacteria bacterium]